MARDLAALGIRSQGGRHLKITTLMENTACRADLAAEHGLSLYIETEDHKILFDAGQSAAFADNAQTLGIDLREVEFAVLSHGHYDHGGGFVRFLDIHDRTKIYVNRHAFEPHYNAKNQYIGLDPQLQKNNRLIFTDGEYPIAEGVRLCSCQVPPADTSGLMVLEDGHMRPEDFRHEQYLLVEENGKTVCFSGCSHKGILNILRCFEPDVLVGGFHFMKLEDEAVLAKAAEELLRHKTTYYTGHCTGEKQFAFLKTIMGDRLHYLSTGSVVEICAKK